ncbi:hypothetical protein SEA_LASTRESORT_73 [Gordonia phage LastResort]|nr:hypothetical protein SEA_LASTRESORT_73 [Gordonia phage LastResort]QDM56249.1 hypothetical protein SEA_REMO_73 [Gordonia phage ReMo]QZD98722.1 hypothetical protein SEA_LOOPER_74 [Gordonia phage Looper]UAJ15565.1 hypothetical protein SEA_BOOHOO_75 [Gordonia Phage Boohoo]UVD39821.1 hypothetical protein SEA_ANAYSIA_75 [Gordonia phage Anaysia]
MTSTTLDKINNLTAAKELLLEDEYSWGRGDLLIRRTDGSKCMCALGAIGVAAAGEDAVLNKSYALFEDDGLSREAAIELATTLLGKRPEIPRLRDEYQHVYIFNDRYKRERDEVIALFDRTIKRLTKQLALETLIEAKRLIVEKGWTKMSLIAPNGCMCALGGIVSATTGITTYEDLIREFGSSYGIFVRDNEYTDEAAIAAVDALRSVVATEHLDGDGDFRDIYRFNDTQPSEEPVLALFDRAIANLTKDA